MIRESMGDACSQLVPDVIVKDETHHHTGGTMPQFVAGCKITI